jgi:two-component system cell cycle response regulator DivK
MNQKRILVTEDNRDQRIILRHQLQRIGTFDLLEATTGQEALDVVAREALDLIILNLGLPVLDGWEVVRRIRAMPSPARDLPIIMFTAYVLPGYEQRARVAGCDEYIAKPVVDFLMMKDKVEQLLTYGRAGRP